MCDPARKETYQEIWKGVKAMYNTGLIVSEANLQAALYAELQNKLPDSYVVVEPTWYDEDDKPRWFPDLVIVDGEEKITDIFELKFKPQGCPDEWKEDIGKLLDYVTDACRRKCPISLEPATGQWKWKWEKYGKKCLQVPEDCRLHFIAVAKPKCPAVLPSDVLKVLKLRNSDKTVTHWFGRTGDRHEWGIQCVTNV